MIIYITFGTQKGLKDYIVTVHPSASMYLASPEIALESELDAPFALIRERCVHFCRVIKNAACRALSKQNGFMESISGEPPARISYCIDCSTITLTQLNNYIDDMQNHIRMGHYIQLEIAGSMKNIPLEIIRLFRLLLDDLRANYSNLEVCGELPELNHDHGDRRNTFSNSGRSNEWGVGV